MDSGRPRERKLTNAQRKLVEDNIGLVSVHLRRRVPNLQRPRRDREWEDLFQEGCLGLIRAASSYNPACGIPFAAYALARIHGVVHKALARRFSIITVPPKRRRTADHADEADTGRMCCRSRAPDEGRPKVHGLPEQAANWPADPRDHHTVDGPHETIGDRIRAKYERAVHRAAETIAAATSTRGDRDELVRVLVAERFLIPNEAARRALRQIARDTHSSYARVAMCDKQLAEGTRKVLEADPEFRELKHKCATNPEGGRRILDETVEGELAGKSRDAFLTRLREADPGQRARMVDALLRVSQDDISQLARHRFARLSPLAREQLLRQCPERTRGGKGGGLLRSGLPRSASRAKR
jgi:hypothetical protein